MRQCGEARRNPDEYGRRTPNTFAARQVLNFFERFLHAVLPDVPAECRQRLLDEYAVDGCHAGFAAAEHGPPLRLGAVGDRSRDARTARQIAADENDARLGLGRVELDEVSVTGVPVEFFDERFTSHDAEQLLLSADMTRKRRKKRLDMLAAQIILNGYLDAHP